MKNLWLLMVAISTILVSCTSPLEKEYNEATAQNDLREALTALEEEDAKLLSSTINKLRSEGRNLEVLTFAQILEEGKRLKSAPQTEVIETTTQPEEVTPTVSDEEATQIANDLLEEFSKQYNELISFKGRSNFKQYGFAPASPYNNWLKEVQRLKNQPNANLLMKHGVLFGELEQLGLAYVRSDGEETEVTTYFNDTFAKAIAQQDKKPKAEEVFESGSLKGYTLLGKWKISNSFTNDSYKYEIFYKGDDYVGVLHFKTRKEEQLEKRGNRYYIVGNSAGEYYQIDSRLNMKLFDKDGSLASVGYSARLLK